MMITLINVITHRQEIARKPPALISDDNNDADDASDDDHIDADNDVDDDFQVGDSQHRAPGSLQTCFNF